MVFLGLWWEPLENNANIFYLKTVFPCFFWACDGNLWKIIPISSFWKRNFRCFFLTCDGNLWKMVSISSIWKWNVRVFSGLVIGTSFENGISVSFWAFLDHNANIFYLKTGFPIFLGLWWEPKLLQSIMGLWTWIMGLPHVVSWTFFFA